MNAQQLPLPGHERRHPRFRKRMHLLPSLFTAGNILLGYAAISQAMQGSVSEAWRFDNAAKAIGFAIVLDILDGRIARITHTTSDFGRELDSLADVITFGVAPALLAWMWGFRLLPPLYDPELRTTLVRLGFIATFAFMIAGAARLARFNIQVNPQPSNPGRPGRKYFVGMPIPAAAGVVAAVIHFARGNPITQWWTAALWLLLLLSASFLMVSTWRFYSFKDIDLRAQRPFRVFVLVALTFAAIVLFSRYVLFLLALTYMLSGVLVRLFYIVRHRCAAAALAEASQPQ
ncbi:MAG TPA: phosphatidylcholine/phosphatidylserine synthase [Terriglobales bacterium]|nr:phosphatidylcholine/phosphatidylserine synthase [Terriglobales bacterium]